MPKKGNAFPSTPPSTFPANAPDSLVSQKIKYPGIHLYLNTPWVCPWQRGSELLAGGDDQQVPNIDSPMCRAELLICPKGQPPNCREGLKVEQAGIG